MNFADGNNYRNFYATFIFRIIDTPRRSKTEKNSQTFLVFIGLAQGILLFIENFAQIRAFSNPRIYFTVLKKTIIPLKEIH